MVVDVSGDPVRTEDRRSKPSGKHHLYSITLNPWRVSNGMLSKCNLLSTLFKANAKQFEANVHNVRELKGLILNDLGYRKREDEQECHRSDQRPNWRRGDM